MIGKTTDPAQPTIACCRLAVQAAALKSARIRAGLDLTALLVATAVAAQLGETPYDKLLAGTAMLSVAVLVFVFRRGRDLERLALARRWREEAVQGRGIPISRWRAGEPLAGWEVRRGEALAQDL
ncbi:hypothetical protein [Sandaracinobacteroides hominis]|uniref:hypothetical protein n=1 Tax=Sandaracinobacteroides hominis TaxID=2780086 RepID=UPI0018F30606|nr:hypothetical protein [Sandaracinobacteroides hominis]